jgi:hypothetical protein
MAIVESTEKEGWVTVFCDGGCGRSVTLRKRKVQEADYYVCNTKAGNCHEHLPELAEGMVRCYIVNAAASFRGYKDKVPDAEELASIERAKQLLHVATSKSAFDCCFN